MKNKGKNKDIKKLGPELMLLQGQTAIEAFKENLLQSIQKNSAKQFYDSSHFV